MCFLIPLSLEPAVHPSLIFSLIRLMAVNESSLSLESTSSTAAMQAATMSSLHSAGLGCWDVRQRVHQGLI